MPGEGLTAIVERGACEGGFWRMELPADEAYHMFEISPGWLHVAEYSYPWVAIGDDAARRATAWADAN